MNGRFTIDAIMRASCSFAINGDDIGISQGESTANPTGKTFGKFLGIDQREDSSKGVVRRDSLGKFQKSPEPLFLLLAEGCNFDPVVRTRYHRTQRYGDNVYQFVPCLEQYPRVAKSCEMILNRSTAGLFHDTSSLG